ncbi:protein halfway [Eupeodes corollae]|uniref:protein halfway n=1 Tax=Eupeodes corollae TaxID=290404 RepID=UPI0024907BAB|nr:protein halfway [Eupeodes corollae]
MGNSTKFLNIGIIVWLCLCCTIIERVLSEEDIQPDQLPEQQHPQSPSSTSSSTPNPIEKADDFRKACFYAEPELCQQFDNDTSNDPCPCRLHPDLPHSWVCCNVVDFYNFSTSCSKSSNSWVNLHIRNATIRWIDISHSTFQKLESLSITDGNIPKITNAMSRASYVKCLNVSNNNLSEINSRAFISLQNFQVLDISSNNLSMIPKLNSHQNLTVDISNNKRLLCNSLLDSIVRGSFKFVLPDTTYCLWNQTYNWFNSTDYMPIRQLERWKRLHSECPKIPGYGNCTCDAEQMAFSTKNDEPHLLFTAKVDCSSLGLIELPPILPDNTIFLNVSNNNITSIGHHFHSNPTYRNINKFDADQNQISSMYELEGTTFMEVFQKFYLRKNAINKIPEYLLSNALDNNPNGRAIYLGGNEINCDCNSAKVLKLWLLARHANIPDYNYILCRNMKQRVIDLQEIKLCQSPHDWTHYIFYLIALEVILLVALIMKVSYDYWVFKTAGYLPWPASKMPKLPCDWLCES